MRGVISVPSGIITGAFNIRLTFIREIELTADAIHVETLEGDALGHEKDNFGGEGKDYHILCYLPDERKGKSRISVVKEGVDVPPVIVEYDTVRSLTPVWGTPVKRNAKIEIPLTLPEAVTGLRKQNFSVSEAVPCFLYGSGHTYQFVVAPSPAQTDFSVSVAGRVRKMNGLRADIQRTILEVDQ